MNRTWWRTLVVAAILLLWTGPAMAVYHPAVGRWLQRDPTGHVDGMSLYQYARSGPGRYVDRMGAQAEDLMPQPKYGLRVADEGLRTALITIMGEVCPCLAYENDGKARIVIKNPHKRDGDKPSREFCCYYKNLPGCNLVMKYAYGGGEAPYPDKRDFPVERGANWSTDFAVMKVKDDAVHTFAHEMIHGTFGVKQQGQIGVQAGTHLVDPAGAKDPGEAQNLPDPAASAVRKILKGLVVDMANCKNRPEFGDKPEQATPETAAAMDAYKAYVQKAEKMAERLLQ